MSDDNERDSTDDDGQVEDNVLSGLADSDPAIPVRRQDDELDDDEDEFAGVNFGNLTGGGASSETDDGGTEKPKEEFLDDGEGDEAGATSASSSTSPTPSDSSAPTSKGEGGLIAIAIILIVLALAAFGGFVYGVVWLLTDDKPQPAATALENGEQEAEQENDSAPADTNASTTASSGTAGSSGSTASEPEAAAKEEPATPKSNAESRRRAQEARLAAAAREAKEEEQKQVLKEIGKVLAACQEDLDKCQDGSLLSEARRLMSELKSLSDSRDARLGDPANGDRFDEWRSLRDNPVRLFDRSDALALWYDFEGAKRVCDDEDTDEASVLHADLIRSRVRRFISTGDGGRVKRYVERVSEFFTRVDACPEPAAGADGTLPSAMGLESKAKAQAETADREKKGAYDRIQGRYIQYAREGKGLSELSLALDAKAIPAAGNFSVPIADPENQLAFRLWYLYIINEDEPRPKDPGKPDARLPLNRNRFHEWLIWRYRAKCFLEKLPAPSATPTKPLSQHLHFARICFSEEEKSAIAELMRHEVKRLPEAVVDLHEEF